MQVASLASGMTVDAARIKIVPEVRTVAPKDPAAPGGKPDPDAGPDNRQGRRRAAALLRRRLRGLGITLAAVVPALGERHARRAATIEGRRRRRPGRFIPKLEVIG